MNETTSVTQGSTTGSTLGEAVERLRRAADVVQERGLTATVRYRAMGPNQLAGWFMDTADGLEAGETLDWRADEFARAALRGTLDFRSPGTRP